MKPNNPERSHEGSDDRKAVERNAENAATKNATSAGPTPTKAEGDRDIAEQNQRNTVRTNDKS